MKKDSKRKFIYLDNNSTSQIDSRVLDTMLPYFSEFYGNASSNHYFGSIARKGVEVARENVAELLHSRTNEIVFTSGATEAINLAIKGYSLSNINKGNHIITVKTEHKAVLDTCKYLESIGFEVTYLPIQKDGILEIEEFTNSFKTNTLLACVMLVNNETGVKQDIRKLCEITHKHNIAFFCDATQAVGKIETDVKNLGVDLMCFSGHKFNGPKGIGGLFIKKGCDVTPLIHGGGHEEGLRSGTLNVPGIVGLGKACEIAKQEMLEKEKTVKPLRDFLEQEILHLPNTKLNGNKIKRIFNTSNICFTGKDASKIIREFEDFAFSNGAACSSRVIEPSHVLMAMGLTENEANSSIRFSLNSSVKINDINTLIKLLKNT